VESPTETQHLAPTAVRAPPSSSDGRLAVRRPEAGPAPPRTLALIPAYNEEHNIARCLDSLLNSDYPKSKLEIIVIDDGSRDSTLKIAKSYEKKGVKVFHKKNSGKANSLNYGIGRATGEIIATIIIETDVPMLQ